MIDAALSSSGPQIVLASSSDENYPPENILNGNTETFWISTGMFPQEFIVRFRSLVKIALVTMHSYNVKMLKIEKNTLNDTLEFEPVAEKEFECTEGHLQTNSFSCLPHEVNQAKGLCMYKTDIYTDLGDITQSRISQLADCPIRVELPGTGVTHLRFIITAGYDHFVSVHRVTVDGAQE